jgi:hypothetical protein
MVLKSWELKGLGPLIVLSSGEHFPDRTLEILFFSRDRLAQSNERADRDGPKLMTILAGTHLHSHFRLVFAAIRKLMQPSSRFAQTVNWFSSRLSCWASLLSITSRRPSPHVSQGVGCEA